MPVKLGVLYLGPRGKKVYQGQFHKLLVRSRNGRLPFWPLTCGVGWPGRGSLRGELLGLPVVLDNIS